MVACESVKGGGKVGNWPKLIGQHTNILQLRLGGNNVWIPDEKSSNKPFLSWNDLVIYALAKGDLVGFLPIAVAVSHNCSKQNCLTAYFALTKVLTYDDFIVR